MRYPKPTKALITQARRLWDDGKTGREIGDVIGRAPTWVSNLAHRKDWPKRYHQGVKAKESEFVTVRCSWCYAHVSVPREGMEPLQPHVCIRRVA